MGPWREGLQTLHACIIQDGIFLGDGFFPFLGSDDLQRWLSYYIGRHKVLVRFALSSPGSCAGGLVTFWFTLGPVEEEVVDDTTSGRECTLPPSVLKGLVGTGTLLF